MPFLKEITGDITGDEVSGVSIVLSCELMSDEELWPAAISVPLLWQ